METPTINPERCNQLDNLANLGMLLGIHDASILLDIEQVVNTEEPLTIEDILSVEK